LRFDNGRDISKLVHIVETMQIVMILLHIPL
jgi:hypothetical protein